MTDKGHQQPGAKPAILSAENAASLPFITDSLRNGLGQLTLSFSESRPLTIMIGEGKAGASLIIGRFIASLEDDVTVTRLTEPSNAIAGMRQIIRDIGFASKEMNLTELENIFTMFLASQKINRRRTIICIEEAQDNDPGMLDQLRRIIERDDKEKYGLTVILSGRPVLNEILKKPPLDALAARAKGRITLAPFVIAETREFARWMMERSGVTDVGQVFDFDAVTLIHELCEGIPDTIGTLCIKAREIAKKQGKTKVDTDLVQEAGELLHLVPNVRLLDEDTVMMKIPKAGSNEVTELYKGRLIVRIDGTVVQEQPVNRERIMIGRDQGCDVRVNSHLVSRHHAVLVIESDRLWLADLGSTNGTFVDGREIKQCDLDDKQVIGVGDSQIEYIADDAREDEFSGLYATGLFAPDEAGTRGARDFAGELQLVDFDPEKTIFDPSRHPIKK